MQTILSWIDGPILSRFAGSITGAICGIIAAHVALDAGQSAQLQAAVQSIVTLAIYALTHKGIITASTAAGNTDAGK